MSQIVAVNSDVTHGRAARLRNLRVYPNVTIDRFAPKRSLVSDEDEN